jgi:hypothetical protein
VARQICHAARFANVSFNRRRSAHPLPPQSKAKAAPAAFHLGNHKPGRVEREFARRVKEGSASPEDEIMAVSWEWQTTPGALIG